MGSKIFLTALMITSGVTFAQATINENTNATDSQSVSTRAAIRLTPDKLKRKYTIWLEGQDFGMHNHHFMPRERGHGDIKSLGFYMPIKNSNFSGGLTYQHMPFTGKTSAIKERLDMQTITATGAWLFMPGFTGWLTAGWSGFRDAQQTIPQGFRVKPDGYGVLYSVGVAYLKEWCNFSVSPFLAERYNFTDRDSVIIRETNRPFPGQRVFYHKLEIGSSASVRHPASNLVLYIQPRYQYDLKHSGSARAKDNHNYVLEGGIKYDAIRVSYIRQRTSNNTLFNIVSGSYTWRC